MKKLKCVLIPLVTVLLAAAWYARYTSLNRFYDSIDDSVEMIYPMGEDVPFGEDYIGGGSPANGYLLRADGFRIADFEDICPGVEGDTPEKLALVEITLKNTGSDAEGVMLSELSLHGIDELLFLDHDALDRLNPGLQGNLGIRLSENTVYSLTLPYDLYRANFSGGTWSRLDQYALFLQLTSFPTCKTIDLRAAASGR